MRGAVLILMLGLSGAAVSQPAPQRRAPRFYERGSPVTAVYPFANRGVLVPDDAGTVSHMVWNGTALVDTRGNAWTQNGTVPQNVASGLYPETFAGAERKGSGLYSDTNYYSLGTGVDVLDFAGDFTATFVMAPTTLAGCSGQLIFFSDGLASTDGWYVQHDASGVFALRQWTAGSGGTAACGGTTRAVVGGVSVVSVGRSGSTLYCKSNADTTGSVAAVTATPATTRSAKLGRYDSAGFSCGPLLYEAAFSSTTWNETAIADMQRRVLAEVGGDGPPITVSRATTETSQIGGANGAIFTNPIGVLGINGSGAYVGAATTNLVIRSDELNNADWTTASGTPTVTAAAGASLYSDDSAGNVADDLEDNDAGSAECIKAATRCGTGTGTFTLSGYVKSVTGATNATLRIVTNGTGTASCETTTLSTGVYKRLSCTATITGAATSNDPWVCAGRQGTVADTAKIRSFGWQCQTGAVATNVCRTAGGTCTTNATLPTAVNNGIAGDFEGQVCATVGPLVSGWVATGDSAIVGFNNAEVYLGSKISASMYDGTGTCTITIADATAAARRVCAWWSASRGKMGIFEVGGSAQTNTCNFDGSMNAVGQPIQFGHRVSSANILNGPMANVVFLRTANVGAW